MKSLQIENLHKNYGKTQVLKGINITLEDGEFLVLVGPSGCGKSTLLNAIAGLDEINSGKILIGEKNVTNIPPKDRGLAMVFQSYALYPNMTVKENIAFGLKINKFSKEEIQKRIKIAGDILHIDNLLDRKPGQLSGGQRQRVAIARAISREPQMYLFDEPLSNLDAELRVKMRSEIKKLHKRVNKTMVYVTHDQVEAMTLADKVAIMDKGIIQQFASPSEVYDNPDNLFTASFIGSPAMNIFGAILEQEKSKLFINLQDDYDNKTKIYLQDNYQNLKNYIGKKVVVGLRPSAIQNGFRNNEDNSQIQNIKIKVDFSELTGSDLFIHSRINDSELIVRVSTSLKFNDGDIVDLKIMTSKIIFFDPDTENRIR